jgi:hypothetical protein
MTNFQRKGAASNTQVGRDFESKARAFFAKQGLNLQPHCKLEIGINDLHKVHSFDLGDYKGKVIVECKSHTWTENWNVPSAKITTWNQAMYFFYTAPRDYRKILFVSRHYCPERRQTLAEYYVKTNPHLIPKDVEIWEFDEMENTAQRIRATD